MARGHSVALALVLGLVSLVAGATVSCATQTTCAACFQADPACAFCTASQACVNTTGSYVCNGTLINPQSQILSFTNPAAGIAARPNYFSVALRYGVPLTLTVSITNLRLPLDLYLIQDLSGSFANDLPVLRGLAPDLLNRINNELSVNSYFGVGAFVDKPQYTMGSPSAGDYVFQQTLACTANTTAVINAMNSLVIRNGFDYPEAQLEALHMVANCPNKVGYRADGVSRRMVMLTTDAPFHFRGDGFVTVQAAPNTGQFFTAPNNADCNLDNWEDYPTVAQLKYSLINNNVIPIFAISARIGLNSVRQYEMAVGMLGFGSVQALSSNSDNLFSAISLAYAQASSVVSLQTGTDTYLLVKSISPSQYTNQVIDQVAPFSITLLYSGRVANTPASTTVTLRALGFGSVTIDVSILTACNCSSVSCPNGCGGRGVCNCGVCQCNSPFTGDDCSCDSTLTCAAQNNCNAHGTCSCGTCQCSAGWSGPSCNCSAAACPGTGLTGCSGHGNCLCGTCQCEAGWGGTADCSCSANSCPSNNASLVCSGHGACSCGQCTCDAFYSESSCNCSLVPCPNACSGHGKCVCGQCQCDAGYSKSDCSCSTAPCPDNCSGRGNCTCGLCVCNNAALFGGDNCNCSQSPCPNACSGHGTCNCGTCTCNPGFSGADCSCSTATCPVDAHNVTCAGSPCSCGLCLCQNPTEFTGPACNCSTQPCPNLCSGHGSCNCGVCTCDPGYESTPDCSCSSAPCPSDPVLGVCSGRGNCTCGQCVCDPADSAWSGDVCNCSTSACEAFSGCFPNGQCVCGQCICNPGFSGPDCQCSQSGCPVGPSGAVCSGHGECNNCSTCECQEGYSLFADCSCSDAPCHASCVPPYGTCSCGVCTCLPGYERPDIGCTCSSTPCPSSDNSQGDGVVCFGHGLCDGCGNCQCDIGYQIKSDCSCSEASCPGDCSGHGNCTCGQCTCDIGWQRDEANYPADNQPDCSCLYREVDPDNCTACYPGHGQCDTCGGCTCNFGFIGSDCSVCNDPSCLPPNPCTATLACADCRNVTDDDGVYQCGFCADYSQCLGINTTRCPTALYVDACPIPAATPAPATSQVLTPEQIRNIGIGVGAGVFGGLIALLLLIRLLTWLKDRREYMKWEEDQKSANWGSGVSPLFNSAFKERESPLYQANINRQ